MSSEEEWTACFKRLEPFGTIYPHASKLALQLITTMHLGTIQCPEIHNSFKRDGLWLVWSNPRQITVSIDEIEKEFILCSIVATCELIEFENPIAAGMYVSRKLRAELSDIQKEEDACAARLKAEGRTRNKI